MHPASGGYYSEHVLEVQLEDGEACYGSSP